MRPQLPHPIPLGDIADVEAYVRAVLATLPAYGRDEREELVLDGLELVMRKHAELRPGQSLHQALGGWLRWRLQDRWRERHTEWRRDTRAATAYPLPLPTQPQTNTARNRTASVASSSSGRTISPLAPIRSGT